MSHLILGCDYLIDKEVSVLFSPAKEVNSRVEVFSKVALTDLIVIFYLVSDTLKVFIDFDSLVKSQLLILI